MKVLAAAAAIGCLSTNAVSGFVVPSVGSQPTTTHAAATGVRNTHREERQQLLSHKLSNQVCMNGQRRPRSDGISSSSSALYMSTEAEVVPEIESPFAAPGSLNGVGAGEGPLPLTLENVEMVLDEMRPYLMSDGGNVAVAEIDGPIVRLELQGACGSCPSSTMTMKMGLERRLIEKIPEIQQVVQSIPEGTPLTEDEVEKVLDGVRPFLSVAGGSIHLESITGVKGIQPTIHLRMDGTSASLRSVKMEIMQRLQRNFMTPGLRVDWA